MGYKIIYINLHIFRFYSNWENCKSTPLCWFDRVYKTKKKCWVLENTRFETCILLIQLNTMVQVRFQMKHLKCLTSIFDVKSLLYFDNLINNSDGILCKIKHLRYWKLLLKLFFQKVSWHGWNWYSSINLWKHHDQNLVYNNLRPLIYFNLIYEPYYFLEIITLILFLPISPPRKLACNHLESIISEDIF